MRNNRRKYDENSLFNKSEFSASDNEIRNKNRKFGNTIKPDRPMKKNLLIPQFLSSMLQIVLFIKQMKFIKL